MRNLNKPAPAKDQMDLIDELTLELGFISSQLAILSDHFESQTSYLDKFTYANFIYAVDSHVEKMKAIIEGASNA